MLTSTVQQGFSQLLRWYEVITFPDPETIKAIQKAKLIHLTVTTMMKGLLEPQKTGDKSWTYPFLQVIYREFNGPGVPRDLGRPSTVSASIFWAMLKKTLDPWEDLGLFLDSFSCAARWQMVSHIQLVIFWALYLQNGHTMPKTFFATIKSREPLAPAALDPKAVISDTAVMDVLMSIFCPVRLSKSTREAPHARETEEVKKDTASKDAHDARRCKELLPFISPFGPSVLRCGKLNCPVQFYTKYDVESGLDTATIVTKARDRRAEHFSEIYGVDKTFKSPTGLPDPTQAPKAPISYHYTLHISTARIWSRLDSKRKQAIAEGLSVEGLYNDPAVSNFVKDVPFEIAATSHCGNIYSASIDREVRAILPSFLSALRVASEKLGLEDKSGLAYVYDWTKNTIQGKMEYERSLS